MDRYVCVYMELIHTNDKTQGEKDLYFNLMGGGVLFSFIILCSVVLCVSFRWFSVATAAAAAAASPPRL